MSRLHHQCDCVIIGAGVAGLWLRAQLAQRGFCVITVERTAAGDGQTLASQGILHRGLKYRVSPEGARAATQLREAESMWDAALRSAGSVKLPDVRIISEKMHMWAPVSGVAGLLAKATASMASMVMTSDARRLEKEQWPQSFRAADPQTAVFEVVERCVDVPSLMQALLHASATPIFKDHPTAIHTGEDGVRITLASGRVITCDTVFACAGNGNEELLRMVGQDPVLMMQRRPLAMVAASGAPFDLNGHCIKPMSDKPRITITTSLHDEIRYWWLGGSLAEDGVDRSDEEQIRAAKDVLHTCVPWIDSSRLSYSVHRISRAEGKNPGGLRPDGPVLRSFGRVHFVWPTKLALAPVAAAMCVECVRNDAIHQSLEASSEIGVATEPWLKGDVLWN